MKKIKIEKNKTCVSKDFKKSDEGEKDNKTDVIVFDKPRKTWWFRVHEESLEWEMASVEMKASNKKDAQFLIYGDPKFIKRVKNDFGGCRLFHPIFYVTNTPRYGMWNLTIDEVRFGKNNPWLKSARIAVEIGQEKWIRIQSNEEISQYDCFGHDNQEAIPQPNWDKTIEEAIADAWGDFILTEEDYETHTLVKEHLSGVKVDFGRDKK